MSEAAESDQAAAPECIPEDSATPATPLTNKDHPPSLKDLLESADDLESAELNNLRNLADQLKLNVHQELESFDNNWKISLSFNSHQHYSMWKTCTIAALFKLQIPETTLKFGPESTAYSYEFKIRVSFEEMEEILQYLKPLTKYSRFDKISLEDENEDIVQFFYDFLMSTSVNTIEFFPQNKNTRMFNQGSEVENFTSWLDLVQKLKPSSVMYYRISFTQGKKKLIDFLGNVADIVENIWIGGTSNPDPDDHIVPIILSILRRKRCNNLYIYNVIATVSYDQIKQMIQYFKTTNRKVTLIVPTDGSVTIGDRIEDYELKEDKTATTGNMVVIDFQIFRENRFCSFDTLPPSEEHCATNDDGCSLTDMLSTADERRIFLKDELICLEKDLSETTDKNEYVVVNSLSVNKSSLTTDTVSLYFSFGSIIERHIWCSVFDAAASKFGLVGHSIISSKDPIRTDLSLTVMWFFPESALDTLEKVLQTMRPLISKCLFKRVHVGVKHGDVSRVCANVLEGSSTEELWIKMEKTTKCKTIHSAAWLDMIRRVKPWSLHCYDFRLNKRYSKFLASAAAEVEKITLAYPSGAVFPLLQEILLGKAKKCKNLKISGSAAKLTPNQVEKLVQSFHQIQREVALTMQADGLIIDTIIGNYKVETGWHRNIADLLVIKHINMPQEDI